jgi:hypothetical protein
MFVGKQILLFALVVGVQIALAQQPDVALRVETAAAPRYPLAAYTMRIEGRVAVDIDIGINGAVLRAEAYDGPYELRPASEKAALGWRFQRISLKEIRKARLIFRFVLSNSKEPTELSAVFRSPFEIEVIGEDESHVILIDPPVEVIPGSKTKKKKVPSKP